MTHDTTIIETAQQVVANELTELKKLAARLDDSFAAACRCILDCSGRVIVTGMGKSGHIGCKIAATLASTGTPAFFVHPSEALHGDLGMIKPEDVVLAISNSGNTDELVTLGSIIKRQGTKLICMSGKPDSLLGRLADHHLSIAVEKEACPHNLAPTTSTTMTLVLGDALAVSLLKARNFTAEDFARSHPAGRLGKRLSVLVSDLMIAQDEMPVCAPDISLRDAILEMTGKKLGATLVMDNGKLLGIFTDGDLRRGFETGTDINNTQLSEVCTQGCHTISASALAIEAMDDMNQKKITVLPVVDDAGTAVGVIHMHDLLRAGIV